MFRSREVVKQFLELGISLENSSQTNELSEEDKAAKYKEFLEALLESAATESDYETETTMKNETINSHVVDVDEIEDETEVVMNKQEPAENLKMNEVIGEKDDPVDQKTDETSRTE